MIDLYLLRIAIRDVTRPRKLMAAVFLILVPCILATLTRSFSDTNDLDTSHVYGVMSEDIVFGFVMVILSVVFCTSVVAQEVEDKTIVYLLTRPVPRYRILSVKFVPALLMTLGTVWASLILTAVATFGPTHLVGTALARDMAIAPIGVLAYGTTFLLLATIVNRPLIYGLLYAFGWESWVPNLPGSFQKLSLMAYLRVLSPHRRPVSEDVDAIKALAPASQDVITSHTSWTVLMSVIVVAFTLSLIAFSLREYVPKDAE